MSNPITTSDLITEVRQMLDEYATDAVTDVQIMNALNRAQRHAMNIVAKHYDDFALAYTTLTVSSETNDVPEDVYAGRIEMIEWLDTSSRPYPVKRISYRNGTFSESLNGSRRPRGWAQVGQTIRWYPKPSTTYTVRVWYTRKIEKLEKSQGRIVGISGLTLTLDSAGDYNATTNPNGLEQQAASGAEARLNCFVNICDAQTGAIKETREVTTISGETVTLASTLAGSRTTVLNKTLATSASLDTSIAEDDIVCNVRGTGVPELFGEAYSDYLIEYASYTVRRALGEAQQDDYTALKELEREVERIWCGRENTLKIHKSSRRWNYGSNRRRLLYS